MCERACMCVGVCVGLRGWPWEQRNCNHILYINVLILGLKVPEHFCMFTCTCHFLYC